jgi:hypothetical protein
MCFLAPLFKKNGKRVRFDPSQRQSTPTVQHPIAQVPWSTYQYQAPNYWIPWQHCSSQWIPVPLYHVPSATTFSGHRNVVINPNANTSSFGTIAHTSNHLSGSSAETHVYPSGPSMIMPSQTSQTSQLNTANFSPSFGARVNPTRYPLDSRNKTSRQSERRPRRKEVSS